MEEIKHSPLPWKMCCDHKDLYGMFERHISLPNGDIYIYGEGKELEANADLIVKSVNSHYALLEALKAFVVQAEESGQHDDVLENAKEAINQAEGV